MIIILLTPPVLAIASGLDTSNIPYLLALAAIQICLCISPVILLDAPTEACVPIHMTLISSTVFGLVVHLKGAWSFTWGSKLITAFLRAEI